MKRPAFQNISKNYLSVFSNMKRSDGSSYVYYKPKTELEMCRAVDDYINNVMMEPEYYVPLPTANTLDYKRHFKNYESMVTNDIHTIKGLRALLSMTKFQKSLWDAKRDGTFYQYKLKAAATVCSRRVRGIKRVAGYLYHNKQFHPLEALQILTCAMRLHIAVDRDNNLRVSKIKNTNQHNIMPVIDDLALIMRNYLRQGLSAKKAFAQGFIDYKNKIQKKGAKLSRFGWVHFPQSSDSEDVYNLQIASSSTDWCIEHDFNQAKQYLSEGCFWIYFEESVAEIAVYLNEDYHPEAFGRGLDQKVEGKYELIAELFLDEYSESLVLDEEDDSFSFNEAERILVTDVLNSLSSGVLENGLFSFAVLNINSGVVKFELPVFISNLISRELSNQLTGLVKMNDLIERHDDETITLHANIIIEGDCDLLSKIVSVQGDLGLSGLSNIHIPRLTFIGGYLDVRNSENLKFPKLKYVSEIVDASGSTCLETPLLDESKKLVHSYYDENMTRYDLAM